MRRSRRAAASPSSGWRATAGWTSASEMMAPASRTRSTCSCRSTRPKWMGPESGSRCRARSPRRTGGRSPSPTVATPAAARPGCRCRSRERTLHNEERCMPLIFTRCSAILVLLAFFAVRAFGQVSVPNTPAGRQLAAWLEVFNRGDRDAYKEFIDKNYPSDPLPVDREMAFREMTGGFDVKQVEPSTADTQAQLLLQERISDQFPRLNLEVENGEPHKVVRLDLMAIPRPAEFPLPHLSGSELIAAARQKLDQDAA